jgi:hypothetical protein
VLTDFYPASPSLMEIILQNYGSRNGIMTAKLRFGKSNIDDQ